MRLAKLLGKLLAPAERPSPARPGSASPEQPEALLAELRRSREELVALRTQMPASSHVARELAEEEQLLLEAEANLTLSLDERRAREALLRARRRATEAELLSDL